MTAQSATKAPPLPSPVAKKNTAPGMREITMTKTMIVTMIAATAPVVPVVVTGDDRAGTDREGVFDMPTIPIQKKSACQNAAEQLEKEKASSPKT